MAVFGYFALKPIPPAGPGKRIRWKRQLIPNFTLPVDWFTGFATKKIRFASHFPF
jgi:hypothetical protein